MKAIRRILTAVIVFELAVSSWFVSTRLNRAEPPVTDSRRLDPLTTEGLEKVRASARDGGPKDWRLLAEAYLGNGYYVAAEQCFRHAAEQDPQDLQSRYGQGFCLERIGKTTRAIEVLSQVATDPLADGELVRTCWYQIGRGFLREENGKSAEEAFRKIDSFPPAAYQLAKLLIRSERSAEALPILEKQLAAMPNSLKLLQLQMHAAQNLGDANLAAKLRDREERAKYQLVLEYGQSFITMFASRYGLSALLSRAMRLKTRGTLASRKAALSKPLKLIRENQLWQYRSVMIAAAHVEFGLGNLDVVKQLITEIEENTQGGTDLLELKAMVATAENDYARAFEIVSRAAAMKPAVELFQMLSEMKSSVDDEARRRYQGLADLRTAMDAFRSGQMETALKTLQRAEPVLATDERYLFYLGEILRVNGEHSKAMQAYRDCLEQNPDHGRALDRVRDLERDVVSGG